MTVNPVLAILFSIVVVVSSKGHNEDTTPNATCSSCCLHGPPGPPGVNGLNGVPGRNGHNGAVGERGPAGERGPVGERGPFGERGPVGETGPVGERGPLGERGPTGEKGQVGERGPAGKRGPSGERGPTGEKGQVGERGRVGERGPAGERGPSGERGAAGERGPVGEPGTLDRDVLRDIVRSLIKEEENTQCGSCTIGQTRLNPAPSCKSILNCNPNAKSQYYWIETAKEGSTVSVPRLMYCYMEADKCGVRGMMRVVNIDMTEPGETCPSPLTKYTANGKRLCVGGNLGQTCSSVTFPTFNYQYTHVCGRAVGYSYYHPCAFFYSQHGSSQSSTLDGAYVAGLSITHGARGSRTHIWTYAGGYQESFSNRCNCPCAKFPGTRPPSYVGDNYYCESATRYMPINYRWFTNNTLWDNQDCYPGSNCCNNPKAPWFVRELATPTQDDVEIRWCTGQGLNRDRVGTELVQIYVY